MKKALAGPAKRPAKKKPERRAMIAATRRRIRALPGAAWKRARTVTIRLDRDVNRLLVWGVPRAERLRRRIAARLRRWARWIGRRLRPVGVLLLRVFSWLERRLLRTPDRAIR